MVEDSVLICLVSPHISIVCSISYQYGISMTYFRQIIFRGILKRGDSLNFNIVYFEHGYQALLYLFDMDENHKFASLYVECKFI